MDNNTIKKYIYKNKPKAKFIRIREGKAYYEVQTYAHKLDFAPIGRIMYEIPVSDMGSADFEREMDANLLNRWIYSYTDLTVNDGRD